MKSTSILTALVTVLSAIVITICPMTSRAAEYAPDSQLDSGSESGSAATGCSLEQPAAPAGCAIAGRHLVAGASIVMLSTKEYYQQVSEPNDASGALLEDLVGKDSGRPEAGR